ncbi:MAG: FAD:protein FMN transferase [Desertimonas sp.]
MGSSVDVIVVGGPEGPGMLVEQARRRIEELEARWSRFRPDSDVSRLNARPNVPVEVHPDTVMLVAAAIEAWRDSGGAVNPTVLGALRSAGYDRNVAGIADVVAPAASRTIIACTDIRIEGSTITLPLGTGFEPGGIGKGLAADVVAAELRRSGADGACVNLGGDVSVSGVGPRGDGWTVAVEAPELARPPLALVGLAAGAIATSTTARRRWWGADGSRRHHLIDPWTGAPSTTEVVQATVIAGSCQVAERHAKTIVLRGVARAFDLLPPDCAAVRIDCDGTVASAGPIHDYLGGRALPTHIKPGVVERSSTPSTTSKGMS